MASSEKDTYSVYRVIDTEFNSTTWIASDTEEALKLHSQYPRNDRFRTIKMPKAHKLNIDIVCEPEQKDAINLQMVGIFVESNTNSVLDFAEKAGVKINNRQQKIDNEKAQGKYIRIFTNAPKDCSMEITLSTFKGKFVDSFNNSDQRFVDELKEIDTTLRPKDYNQQVFELATQSDEGEHSRGFKSKIKALKEKIPMEDVQAHGVQRAGRG